MVNSRWPMINSAAGSINFTQIPGPIIKPKCVPSNTAKMASVNNAAGPARSFGNNKIK